jgi:hypothetical protein
MSKGFIMSFEGVAAVTILLAAIAYFGIIFFDSSSIEQYHLTKIARDIGHLNEIYGISFFPDGYCSEGENIASADIVSLSTNDSSSGTYWGESEIRKNTYNVSICLQETGSVRISNIESTIVAENASSVQLNITVINERSNSFLGDLCIYSDLLDDCSALSLNQYEKDIVSFSLVPNITQSCFEINITVSDSYTSTEVCTMRQRAVRNFNIPEYPGVIPILLLVILISRFAK